MNRATGIDRKRMQVRGLGRVPDFAPSVAKKLPADISEIQFNDESMLLIVFGIALECHDFALSRGISSHSVEDQLPLVFSVLDGHLSCLLNISDIATVGTTSVAGLTICFSNEGYRFLTDTAKNRVADSIDGDRDV